MPNNSFALAMLFMASSFSAAWSATTNGAGIVKPNVMHPVAPSAKPNAMHPVAPPVKPNAKISVSQSVQMPVVHPAAPLIKVAPPEPMMTPQETAAAIAELRARHPIMPIQGVQPSTIKGSYYSMRGNEMHHASDILAPRNTPIMAADDGTVAKLFQSKAGGTTIYEYDPSGKYVYYYAHLQAYAPNLHEGQKLHKGEVIGFVGTSGNAPPNTPHLHLSIGKLVAPNHWWQAAPIDPYEVYR